MVRDRILMRASQAARHAHGPHGRTRVKTIGAGNVSAVVDLLLDDPERRARELALAVRDLTVHVCRGPH